MVCAPLATQATTLTKKQKLAQHAAAKHQTALLATYKVASVILVIHSTLLVPETIRIQTLMAVIRMATATMMIFKSVLVDLPALTVTERLTQLASALSVHLASTSTLQI